MLGCPVTGPESTLRSPFSVENFNVQSCCFVFDFFAVPVAAVVVVVVRILPRNSNVLTASRHIMSD